MSYATEIEISVSKSLGYTNNCNVQRGHVFDRGNLHVWSIFHDWQTARLIGGQYTKHKKFADLTEALRARSWT